VAPTLFSGNPTERLANTPQSPVSKKGAPPFLKMKVGGSGAKGLEDPVGRDRARVRPGKEKRGGTGRGAAAPFLKGCRNVRRGG